MTSGGSWIEAVPRPRAQAAPGVAPRPGGSLTCGQADRVHRVRAGSSPTRPACGRARPRLRPRLHALPARRADAAGGALHGLLHLSPFCHQGCPLGQPDPLDWNDLALSRQLARGHRTGCTTYNFPEFTGPAPCEGSCVSGINVVPCVDQVDLSCPPLDFAAPRRGRIVAIPLDTHGGRLPRVAIVGSGLVSLCAVSSIAAGTPSLSSVGPSHADVLATGIPEFKLEKRRARSPSLASRQEGVVFRAACTSAPHGRTCNATSMRSARRRRRARPRDSTCRAAASPACTSQSITCRARIASARATQVAETRRVVRGGRCRGNPRRCRRRR